MTYPWIGKAIKIDDYDLPRIGNKIGVGEDIVHMILDVESRGKGFDSNGVIKLFERHKFYKNLPANKREEAISKGLATKNWIRDYKNNHEIFLQAYQFDPKAAMLSTSWGLGQILGENYELAGYNFVEDMIKSFAEDEANQLDGMINYLLKTNLDDELRLMDETTDPKQLLSLARIVARGYNGKSYEKNNYHIRLVERLNWWRKKPDTKWFPEIAEMEEINAENMIKEQIKKKFDELFGDKSMSTPLREKYIKVKSVSWWSGFIPLVGGILLLTKDFHGLAPFASLIADQYEGMSAIAMINYGMTIIGLRGKDG